MANQDHLDILKQGTETWNRWRKEHSDIQPDLREASLFGSDLSAINLSYANFFEADLRQANLKGGNLSAANFLRADLRTANFLGSDLSGAYFGEAILSDANLSSAILSGAHLIDANLSYADLRKADLKQAYLFGAKLIETDLRGADLSGAHLDGATLVRTDLRSAILTECSIHGISAWSVKLEGAKQDNLVITHAEEPTITVDNLKVAQFIYLLLSNAEIRDVIDTIARKAVLILGRFTPERKAILDALRGELRKHNYLPILFDFEKPDTRTLTDTVSTLAHLSLFIIADLTDPSCIPWELGRIVPSLAVPVQPILLKGKKEFSMFIDLPKDRVLPIHYYTDQDNLLATLKQRIIEPAEQKARELQKR